MAPVTSLPASTGRTGTAWAAAWPIPRPYAGAVLDLEWWHGELWASGFFNHAGDIQANSIAHWNGHRWCVPPGDFRQANANFLSDVADMAIWRDSLYVCRGFATIDGDSIRQVAQWIGGDAVADCSTVGINEVAGHAADLSVTPLSEPGRWNVHFPSNGTWALNAFDVMGRSVGHWRANSTSMVVDLSGQSPGIYLLRARSTAGEVRSARIVRP